MVASEIAEARRGGGDVIGKLINRNGAKTGYSARYSAFDLFRRGLTGSEWPQAWRSHDLKSSYEAVIVGGGVHGLATAYYLAKEHGITDVAVLDKG